MQVPQTYGFISVACAVYESDDETPAERDGLLDQFAGSVGPGFGNGKAAAVAYAREGGSVVCVDVNLDAAKNTLDVIEAEGGNTR